MNRKDDYLRFEYGNIINFSKNQEELNSSDFRTANDKKLFNIFSGGKDVLGKKEYKSLWQSVKEYASKNGNAELFDEEEKQVLLDDINKKSGEHFDMTTLTNFLYRVFQKPDKLKLDDTAQINAPYHEMRENDSIKIKNIANTQEAKKEFAEHLFNPENKECEVIYSDDNKIASKSIKDANGNLLRTITYDKNGQPENVEIKIESGWEITDFNPDYGEYSIIKTGTDKNKKLSEVMMNNNKIYMKVEYNPNNPEERKESVYSIDKNNRLAYTTEYKDNKRVRVVNYNEEGEREQSCEYIYEKDFSDGVYPASLRTYNARGELINVYDNKTQKEYDGKGNEIKTKDNQVDENKELWDLTESLMQNFTTEKLLSINEKNVLKLIASYEAESEIETYRNPNHTKQTLIEKILTTENPEEKRVQVKILVDALKGSIDTRLGYNTRVSDENLQSGKQKLNQMLDECLLDNVDDKTVKDNVEKVSYLLKNSFYEFGGFTHNDIPNGKIDKYSYQNHVGDCWLLSSLDSLSELKNGQKFINDCIENDSVNKKVNIKLEGGKVTYSFSYEEIQNAYHFSIGDADMKALEMAYEKYHQEFKPNDKDNIEGGWMKDAFGILSGNKPMEAVVNNGKAGVMIDGNFVEINKKNRQKLKHIPIEIKNVTPEIMAQIKDVQEFTAKTLTSADIDKLSRHAFYITDVAENGQITVKEPNSPNLSRTFTQDRFFELYDEGMTIFVL